VSQRESFLEFYELHMNTESAYEKTSIMKKLLSVYLSFSDPTNRAEFMDFYKLYAKENQYNYIECFIPVYRTFSQNRQELEKFMRNWSYVTKDKNELYSKAAELKPLLSSWLGLEESKKD
jgi:hypothetical protein